MAQKDENKMGKRKIKKQKENLKKMEEEIKKSKKIDKDYLKKIYKKVFENLSIAVAMMGFLYCMNIGVVNIEPLVYALDIKVLSLISLGVTLVLFEVAYKKDNGNIAIHGIEMLALSIVVALLFIPFKKFDLEGFRRIVAIATLIVGFYFFIKSFIISSNMKKKYFKEKNDISEIVKK